MTSRSAKRLIPLLALALLLLSLWGMGSGSQAQSNVTNFTTVKASRDIFAARDIQAGDDVTVTGDLVLSPRTAISVTMNATINPTGSYQPLTSAGTVNTASITIKPAGMVLTLVNMSNTSIVLTDTGTLKLSGNLTLGQYDSLVLVSDGTNWVQRSTSNN